MVTIDLTPRRIGALMPLSARRVVTYCGRTTQAATKLGQVAGMGDGSVIVYDYASGRVLHELTPTEALAISDALDRAARGVQVWQEHASGYNRVRVARDDAGNVDVTYRGATHRMRPLRAKTDTRNPHRCQVCSLSSGLGGGGPVRGPIVDFFVLADPGKPWNRTTFCEVCAACVEKLANAPEEIAEVTPLRPAMETP